MDSDGSNRRTPEKTGPCAYSVYGPEDAITALGLLDYEAYLREHPHARIKLSFSSSERPRLVPDDPLVKELAEIAKFYEVVVERHIGLPFTLDPDALSDFVPTVIYIYAKP